LIRITSVRHNWPNPPGFHLDRPCGHPDYTFVHFATEVELELDGSTVTVPEHACILYKPQTPQRFHCPHGMIHDWFHFTNIPPNLFDEFGISTDVLIFPKQWTFLTDLIAEIENEFFAKRACHEHLIDSLVKELFIRLSRALNSDYSEVLNEKFTPELRQLRAMISQNLSHDWTVAEMASKLMLSPSRFAHLYHAFYGTTPIDDLIRMRIHAAQNALAFTQSSICEIADSVGYRNITHFCRQFHKIVGISPSQYRKNGQITSDTSA